MKLRLLLRSHLTALPALRQPAVGKLRWRWSAAMTPMIVAPYSKETWEYDAPRPAKSSHTVDGNWCRRGGALRQLIGALSIHSGTGNCLSKRSRTHCLHASHSGSRDWLVL